MSTAVAEEKKTETKLNQLDQLKKFTMVVADTARLRVDQGIQAAGRDDKSEPDLCRDAKGKIFSSAR